MPLPFPNVPFAAGVPQVPRSALIDVGDTVSIGTQATDSTLWQSTQAQPTWGVFDSQGRIVLTPDSVIDFAVRNESKIPTFPVEQGSFSNYDKVILPFEIPLRFSKGGTKYDRATFLQQVDTLYRSLDLSTIRTPERTYLNVNLYRYEITRRGAQGAYFLTDVDCYFQQINEVTAQYTTTATNTTDAQNTAAQPVSNVGTVYTQTPSQPVAAAGHTAIANTASQ